MRFFLYLAAAIILVALLITQNVGLQIGPMKPNSALPTFSQVSGQVGGATPNPSDYQPPPPRPFEFESGCNFPGLSDDTQLVLLGTHGAQALSSATLGSQDIAVTAGTLQIEDGDSPLYIVLVSFEPVIWKVSGAVNRVRHLVLAAEETNSTLFSNEPVLQGLAGATGIDADKVRVLESSKCLHPFNGADQPEAAIAVEAMRHYLSRKPDVVAGAEHVSGFSAPSGAIHQAGSEFHFSFLAVLPRRILEWTGLRKPVPDVEADLRYEMDKFNPGGVMQIDAAQVVSRHSAAPYAVLPQEAGLLQLMERGDLEPDDTGNLVIRRAIHLPAGLTGAHLRHFVLATGVPPPTGKPGHSCVIAQDSGKALSSDGFC